MGKVSLMYVINFLVYGGNYMFIKVRSKERWVKVERWFVVK